MRTSSFFVTGLLAATALAQAVPEGVAPSTPAPEGCVKSASSNFTIGTLKVGHKKRETAQDAADSALICSLSDGILRDRDGRTGSVVANRQFQFDGPPQAGAIYTGGFSICTNGSLAIGGTTRWWQCSSGGFYNLYDEYIGAQCEEIRIQIDLLEEPAASSTAAGAETETPIASVQSSLATVSGEASTISKSAIGPSASFASVTGNSSVTPTGSITSSGDASNTAPTSSGTSAASNLPAPPADGAGVAFGVAKGSLFGAFAVIFGAALVL